jgi:hypothetical protein
MEGPPAADKRSANLRQRHQRTEDSPIVRPTKDLPVFGRPTGQTRGELRGLDRYRIEASLLALRVRRRPLRA